MDAYSVSCTSLSRSNSSRRIYQDLKTVHFLNLAQLDPTQLEFSLRALNDTLESQPRSIDRKPQSIGVVGGGVAGLRCADILLHYGFDVTILEGRSRLGGRLHQERLPNGHLVDLGPNWIHGTNSNPIMDLARLTKTPTSAWDTQASVFDEHGQLLDAKDSDECSTIMWDIIQAAFKHSENHSADISPDESLADFFRTKILEIIPETADNYRRKREIVIQMTELWGAFIGSPITRQSLKFFWLEECIDGENLFCAGTYQHILKEIARPAVRGATIKYDTVVSKIHGKSAGGSKVLVATTAGRTFEFDEVVVTAPLGWLKRHLDAFDPPLPGEIVDAIGNISYGCLEKVYISFPEAFWLGADDNGSDSAKGFCQWLSPNYALDSNPERWTHEVVELASLTPSSASHPTLLFYVYGAESQHLTSTTRSFPTRDKRDSFLYSFFKPYYSRLPHFDEADPRCRPTGCLATDWLNDDLAGNGSYGNFQVGLQEGDRDIRAMREGVPSEGVWLAGEHTAPFVALGTVTGAYWSGESVGRRIAEVYGKGKATPIPEGL